MATTRSREARAAEELPHLNGQHVVQSVCILCYCYVCTSAHPNITMHVYEEFRPPLGDFYYHWPFLFTQHQRSNANALLYLWTYTYFTLGLQHLIGYPTFCSYDSNIQELGYDSTEHLFPQELKKKRFSGRSFYPRFCRKRETRIYWVLLYRNLYGSESLLAGSGILAAGCSAAPPACAESLILIL